MRNFLSLKSRLVGSFNEAHAPTCRIYVVRQGLPTPNYAKKFQTFWLHSSVFALEKEPEKLHFQSFFSSKKPFGGYFQWNACTYFQKIYSWRRFTDAKLFKNLWTFLVAFLRFCFRKTTWTAKFSESCYL